MAPRLGGEQSADFSGNEGCSQECAEKSDVVATQNPVVAEFIKLLPLLPEATQQDLLRRARAAFWAKIDAAIPLSVQLTRIGCPADASTDENLTSQSSEPLAMARAGSQTASASSRGPRERPP